MESNMRPFKYKVFGRGQPIVIIPGLDGVTEFFADIYPALSANYQVIKYYLPLLDEASALGQPYTYEFIAADIKKILDELRIQKTHVIGESFGGAVAQVFALEYPEMLDRLVVLSSAAKFNISLKLKIQLRIFPFIPMWLFARIHLHEVCEPVDPQWAKDMFVRNATWADHKTVVARARIAAKFNITDRVSKIKNPTLIVVGGADRFTSEGSRQLHELHPNSEMVTIEGSGHLCHMVTPELFVQEVEKFLLKV